MSCALPDSEHSERRTRAAHRYARTLTLYDGRDAEVYAALKEHYAMAQIVELSAPPC